MNSLIFPLSILGFKNESLKSYEQLATQKTLYGLVFEVSLLPSENWAEGDFFDEVAEGVVFAL